MAFVSSALVIATGGAAPSPLPGGGRSDWRAKRADPGEWPSRLSARQQPLTVRALLCSRGRPLGEVSRRERNMHHLRREHLLAAAEARATLALVGRDAFAELGAAHALPVARVDCRFVELATG